MYTYRFFSLHGILLVLGLWTAPYTLPAQCDAPGADGQPVEVGIKVLVNRILAINTLEEAFDLDGYLTMAWTDPTLCEKLPEAQDEKKLIYDEETIDALLGVKIWYPNPEFMNSVNPRETSKRRLEIHGNKIVYAERFTVKLQSPMDFRAFPFDRQHCKLEVESFGFNAGQFVFKPLEEEMDISGHIENDAWKFSQVRSRTYLFPYFSPIARDESSTVYFSRFEFSLLAERRAGYFIWQFFLPLFILVVATWFIPALWKSGSSYELVYTMLLTSVMFGFYTSAFLPQLSYNTFLETIVIVSNGIVFTTLLLVLTRKNRKKLPWYYRPWALPVISIAAYLFVIWHFFGPLPFKF